MNTGKSTAKVSTSFTNEEKAAMKVRAQELKAEALAGAETATSQEDNPALFHSPEILLTPQPGRAGTKKGSTTKGNRYHLRGEKIPAQ
jgi:hypothetical protein